MSELHISESNTTLPQIDFDLLDKWIEALRSGKYQQIDGHLRRADKHCCLGVLCDISGIGSWRHAEYDQGFEFVVGKSDAVRDGDLPFELIEAMGFLTGFGARPNLTPWVTLPPNTEEGWGEISVTRLTELNDEWGYDFGQIADLLEKYRDDMKARLN